MNHTQLENYFIPDLDINAGLQWAGNVTGTYLRFLGNFYQNGHQYRNELQLALQDADHARLAQLLHGLHGVAATLGAFQLDQSCSALLQKIREDTDNLSPILISKVFHSLDKLLSGIENSTILDQISLHKRDINSNTGILRGFNLILIEDDAVLRKMLINELQQHVDEAIWFGLKRDALNFLQQQKSLTRSILVIDAKLPDGSGIDLAKLVSQNYPDAFIFLISGAEIPSNDMAHIKNGIQLLKPFSIAELLTLCKGVALNFLNQAEFTVGKGF